MHQFTNEYASTWLVRLSQASGPERVFALPPSGDRTIALGSDPAADFVVQGFWVLPLHCYLERHGSHVWLCSPVAGNGVRLNGKTVTKAALLDELNVVEFGGARVHMTVYEENIVDNVLGPRGTELLDRVWLQPLQDVPAPDAVTTRVHNASQILDSMDVPTTSWHRQGAEADDDDLYETLVMNEHCVTGRNDELSGMDHATLTLGSASQYQRKPITPRPILSVGSLNEPAAEPSRVPQTKARRRSGTTRAASVFVVVAVLVSAVGAYAVAALAGGHALRHDNLGESGYSWNVWR